MKINKLYTEYRVWGMSRQQESKDEETFREGEFWKFKCSYKYKLGEVDKYECAISSNRVSVLSFIYILDSLKRHPAWTDRIMYTTYNDSPDTPTKSNITNALYTSIPSYTTSDHVSSFHSYI